MKGSLQDQLLEAGAIKKDRAQKINKTKRKQNKQKQRGASEVDEIKRAAEIAQAEKAAKDLEFNRLKQEELATKELAAQIKQLIGANKVNDDAGEEAYNFNYQNKVKTIYVTEEQRKALANGRLAIVNCESVFSLVPAAVARKVMERDPETVISLVAPDAESEVHEDDAYAEYVIPDDLNW